MKIVIVTDKENSAIDRIAQLIQKHLDHLNIVICRVHPKRPSPESLEHFKKHASDCDLIDFEYWKSASLLREKFPKLCNTKTILSHHNPYDLKGDWSSYDVVLAKNKEIKSNLDSQNLKDVRMIHLPVDLDSFKITQDYDVKSNTVLMVAARIEGSKGIYPVAKVCKKLGYKFVLVGSISKPEYFKDIEALFPGGKGFEFHNQISDAKLVSLYNSSALHVCNSQDGFESGTMPILEAMACGLPVLTRRIGHVPDFASGENIYVREGKYDDELDLEHSLKVLIKDYNRRCKIRQAAKKTINSYSSKRMAWFYENLYYELAYKKKLLVSVVIPTFNRSEILLKNLDRIAKSTYQPLEIVVADDGSSDKTKEKVLAFRRTCKVPIKYINTNTPNQYNLAYARNLGAIHASGDILVFCDERLSPEPDAISNFVGALKSKYFLYGVKGNVAKGFVENFSCIYRSDFIDAGMFATGFPYGFLSQETRCRFKAQGFYMTRVDNAKADVLLSSSSKWSNYDSITESKDLLFKMGYGGV